MAYSCDVVVSVDVPGHGIHKVSAAAFDAALAYFGTHTLEQLQTAAIDMAGGQVDYGDVDSVGTLVAILADFCFDKDGRSIDFQRAHRQMSC